MAVPMISIPVDDETARAFAAASPEDRQKMQVLLHLRLRELTDTPAETLAQIMDDIGNRAAAHGLTAESLAALLADD